MANKYLEKIAGMKEGLIGAGVGAGIGALSNKDNRAKGALIGAGVGGALGAITKVNRGSHSMQGKVSYKDGTEAHFTFKNS